MQIDPMLALGVTLSAAADRCCVRDVQRCSRGAQARSCASWSAVWYLLSAFVVISYTRHWVYVGFAALGSWIGAYLSMTWL
jgi:hypothetical protein